MNIIESPGSDTRVDKADFDRAAVLARPDWRDARSLIGVPDWFGKEYRSFIQIASGETPSADPHYRDRKLIPLLQTLYEGPFGKYKRADTDYDEVTNALKSIAHGMNALTRPFFPNGEKRYMVFYENYFQKEYGYMIGIKGGFYVCAPTRVSSEQDKSVPYVPVVDEQNVVQYTHTPSDQSTSVIFTSCLHRNSSAPFDQVQLTSLNDGVILTWYQLGTAENGYDRRIKTERSQLVLPSK